MADSKKYEIQVTTQVEYIPEQSSEEQDRYVFAYTISITNTGSIPAQLISRHWVITDATDNVQEVRGLGVVGEQPLLKPGESFEYTKWWPKTARNSLRLSTNSRSACREFCIDLFSLLIKIARSVTFAHHPFYFSSVRCTTRSKSANPVRRPLPAITNPLFPTVSLSIEKWLYTAIAILTVMAVVAQEIKLSMTVSLSPSSLREYRFTQLNYRDD
jgi:uncharacterized protein affecting Mg2+/Co2+ transport